MVQALAGSLAGVGGALLLARLMSKMLFGVRPDDPLTFGHGVRRFRLDGRRASNRWSHHARSDCPLIAPAR
jgi:hypothetical protein